MDHPTGTVTLVFTDVQGSTELWERLGDRFGGQLEHHNRELRKLIDRFGGYEVKTEGDAFMVAFARAGDAVGFTLEVQESVALESSAPEDAEIRIRIGAHTGDPICQLDPTTGRMDYFGPMVNRAARIASAGHGGQILISQACLEAARESVLESQADLLDLGEHRFKGLSRGEHVHQLLPRAQAGRRFPKLETLDELPTNLPDLATTFVGRVREWNEVSGLLLESAVRLVTLTGPGGIGKTRLSLRVASEVLDQFEGGVWFCDLTEAWTSEAICTAIAGAFSVPLPAGQPPVEAIGAVLEFRKPLVIVLDNFEQVVEHAGATIGQWLRSAPHVKFLVTSRTTLALSGEREYRLEPLPLPPISGEATDRMGDYDVVRLFVERAREAKPGFAFNESNAGDIARICASLEGMPLAIELAAARVKLMAPAQMVKKLDHKFQLLRSSRRDLPARQQTLEGAIDWSYDLLKDWEKAAFCQVCAFRGSFFLEAAEEVLDLSAFDDAPFGMDAVEALREHSLLATRETAHGTRLRMYVAIREYAQTKISEILTDHERGTLNERHASYFVQYAEEWDQRRGTGDAVEAFDRLELDIENLFAVEDRAIQAGDALTAARIALAMSTTMAIRGLSAHRLPRLERALEAVRAGQEVNHLLESRLLTALCLACQDRGEWNRASAVAQESLLLAESLGADRERGDALIQQGEMHRLRGDLDRALECFDLAEDIFERIGDIPARARSIGGRGSVLWKRGRYDEAIECFTKAAELFEDVGNAAGRARNVGGRGIILAELHDYDGAIKCYEEAETMHRMLGNQLQLAQTIGNKAIVHYDRGDHEAALTCLGEAEELNREQGHRANVARNVGIRGRVYDAQGRLEEAMVCFAEAEEIHRGLGNRSGIASNVARRGHGLLELSRPDEATEALEEALELFKSIGEGCTREAYECAAALAQAQSLCGDEEIAAERAREALEVARATGLSGARFDEALMDQLSALRRLADRRSGGVAGAGGVD